MKIIGFYDKFDPARESDPEWEGYDQVLCLCDTCAERYENWEVADLGKAEEGDKCNGVKCN
jgi:hypothetical protein